MARLSLVAAATAALWLVTTSAQGQYWPGGDQWPEEGAQPRPQPPGVQSPPAAPAEPPPPSLLETSTHAMDLVGVFGFTTEEGFDDALRAHGYSDPLGVFGGDVSSVWRVASVFWLGGRIGYRYRSWEQEGLPSIDASGFAAWIVAELRLPLGRAWELGLTAGAGGGAVGLVVNEAVRFHGAPSAVAGAFLGFTLAGPVRVYSRFCYEYLEAANVNEWGHDVNLSGGSFALGLEIRR